MRSMDMLRTRSPWSHKSVVEELRGVLLVWNRKIAITESIRSKCVDGFVSSALRKVCLRKFTFSAIMYMVMSPGTCT